MDTVTDLQSISVRRFGDYSFEVVMTHQVLLLEFITGGIGLIEMVENSNLFLLVGGGMMPLFSPNQVYTLLRHNM